MLMKRGLPTVALAALLPLAVGISVSVGLSQQVVRLADDKSDLRLEIGADEATYRAGGHISLREHLRNLKGVPVQVSVLRPAELFFRFVVVKVENSGLSAPVVLTELGRERTDDMRAFATRSWMLPVGESVDGTLDIGAWYRWQPGTYKVACYVDMPTSSAYGSPKLRYSSNELTLTVTP